MLFISSMFISEVSAATPPTWTTEDITFGSSYGVYDLLEYGDRLYAATFPAPLLGSIPSEQTAFKDTATSIRELREATTSPQSDQPRTRNEEQLLSEGDVPFYVKSGSTWSEVDTSEMSLYDNYYITEMVIYDGTLTVGTRNDSYGAEVWQYDGSTWLGDGLGWGGSGWWDADNTDVTGLAVLNDILYVGFTNANGAEVWSYNGSTWARVNTDGFGDLGTHYVDSLTVHNSVLYAGVLQTIPSWYVRVFRYDGGTTWTQINIDGFGDTHTGGVYALTSFNGGLYAGVEDSEGAEVWKYNGTGTSWTKVNVNGFGNSNSDYLSDFIVYNGKLCVSVGGQVAEVWQWNDSAWSLAGASGMDDPNRVFANGLGSYHGKLYAGAQVDFFTSQIASWYNIDTSSVYRFWNNTSRHHFYTISSAEKDFVIANYPEWSYEGPVYTTAPASAEGLSPVYRFWSNRYRGHFYTISAVERDYVIANYASDWAYEGIAYYAGETVGAASLPVFRFWSNNYKKPLLHDIRG